MQDSACPNCGRQLMWPSEAGPDGGPRMATCGNCYFPLRREKLVGRIENEEIFAAAVVDYGAEGLQPLNAKEITYLSRLFWENRRLRPLYDDADVLAYEAQGDTYLVSFRDKAALNRAFRRLKTTGRVVEPPEDIETGSLEEDYRDLASLVADDGEAPMPPTPQQSASIPGATPVAAAPSKVGEPGDAPASPRMEPLDDPCPRCGGCYLFPQGVRNPHAAKCPRCGFPLDCKEILDRIALGGITDIVTFNIGEAPGWYVQRIDPEHLAFRLQLATRRRFLPKPVFSDETTVALDVLLSRIVVSFDGPAAIITAVEALYPPPRPVPVWPEQEALVRAFATISTKMSTPLPSFPFQEPIEERQAHRNNFLRKVLSVLRLPDPARKCEN